MGTLAKKGRSREDVGNPTIPRGKRNFSEVFSEAVSGAMTEVLGTTGERAMSFYLRPLDFDDVEDFRRKLRAILGTGALALDRVIVEHLARQLEVPSSELRPRDLAGSASIARGMLERRGEGPRK